MREIVVTLSGEELAKGPLPDKLIAAIQKTLVAHGYRDHEHTWSGTDHRLVYRTK